MHLPINGIGEETGYSRKARSGQEIVRMKCIAAVDENWGIGKNGGLLLRVPADMKRFRLLTTEGVVVLGRKTMDTFPQKQPLPNRTNVILTTRGDYRVGSTSSGTGKNVKIVHSMEEATRLLETYPQDQVFIIGGESIYRQFLPYCNECLITHFERAYDADAYFPNLEKDPVWELTEESEEQVYFDTTYTFRTYRRIPK